MLRCREGGGQDTIKTQERIRESEKERKVNHIFVFSDTSVFFLYVVDQFCVFEGFCSPHVHPCVCLWVSSVTRWIKTGSLIS